METGPWFKVSSERPGEQGSVLRSLDWLKVKKLLLEERSFSFKMKDS